MKNPFSPGDKKTYEVTVTPDMQAQFHGRVVHPVYSTFALARDAEWCCRLFVLDMLEEGEEGVGSYVSVEHKAPARVGETVTLTATLMWIEGRAIRCSYQAHVGSRLVAQGEQEQRIIWKERFDQLLSELQ